MDGQLLVLWICSLKIAAGVRVPLAAILETWPSSYRPATRA